MKRFLLLMVVFLMATVSMFAQKQTKALPRLQDVRTSVQMTPNASRVFGQRSSTWRAPMKAEGEVVTPPDGIVPEEWTVSGTFYAWGGSDVGWVDIASYVPTANVIINGDEIYIQGLAYWCPEAWIKGSISGGNAVFPSSTYLGKDSYGDDEWFVGSEDGSTLSEVVFTYNEETQVLDCQTFLIESSAPDEVYAYTYWMSLTISKYGSGDSVVTPPDDLKTRECVLTALIVGKDGTEEVTNLVYAGEKDGLFYVQGTNPYLPEAWIVGVMEGNQITFATGQYYGKYSTYKMYFVGINGEEFTDVVFTLNDDQSAMTTSTIVGLSMSDPTDPENIFAEYSNVKIEKISEKAGTPSDPEISYDEGSYGPYIDCYIPFVDTDGNYMLPSKMTYTIYKDIEGVISKHTLVAGEYYEELEENMTEIPYLYTDDWDVYVGAETVYLYGEDVSEWNRVGLQVTYYGMGEVHSSNIVWAVIKEGTGIEAITKTVNEGSLFFNLSGQRVANPQRGIYIVNGKKVLIK